MKADWGWNGIYQDLYDTTKKVIKKDILMNFYDASRPVFLKTYVSGVGLGAGLLQVREARIMGIMK